MSKGTKNVQGQTVILRGVLRPIKGVSEAKALVAFD